MEAGMSLDPLWMHLKPTTALGLDLLQFIQGGEDPIGQWLVGKGPQSLSGLHLWGIRGQEHQVDPLRQLESSTAVPPGTIQNQPDLVVWPCSHLLGKSGQGEGEDLNADRGQEPPTRLSALWMHKGKDVHPFVALGYRGFDRRSLGSPDPSQDWFEADPMLIHRPELDAGLGVVVLPQGELVRQFFSTPALWPRRLWRAAGEARGCCDRAAADTPTRVAEPRSGLSVAASSQPLSGHSRARPLPEAPAELLPAPPGAWARAEADSRLSHDDDLRCLLLLAHSSAQSPCAPIWPCSPVTRRSLVAFCPPLPATEYASEFAPLDLSPADTAHVTLPLCSPFGF